MKGMFPDFAVEIGGDGDSLTGIVNESCKCPDSQRSADTTVGWTPEDAAAPLKIPIIQ